MTSSLLALNNAFFRVLILYNISNNPKVEILSIKIPGVRILRKSGPWLLRLKIKTSWRFLGQCPVN